MAWQNENETQEERRDGQEIIRQIIEHCKKITEALYRITDLFPEKEPLKWSLREDGMKIFRLFISLNNQKFVKEKINLVLEAEIKIGQIIDLLEMASSNSFITGINFTVLKREYLRLKSAIAEHQSFYSEKEEPVNIKSLPVFNFLTDNSDLKTDNVNLNEMSIKDSNGHSENLMDIKNSKEYNDLPFKMSISEKGLHSTIKTKMDAKRSVQILDIIRSTEKGFIGVNEIYGHFKKISKKTIRRDLITLVQEGILKIDGEKRWRRYILNKI